jgi:hypothetical protein
MYSIMNEKYKKVIVGSRWRSVSTFVIVESVESRTNGIWVKYSNGDELFECLVEAFLQRYAETV